MTNRKPLAAQSAPVAPAIAAVMARLANGDSTAAVDLYTYYFRQIAGTVRCRAMSMGHDLGSDDLQDIVWSTAELLGRRVCRWNVDGAAPWTWAARGIDGLIVQHVGPSRASHVDETFQIEVPARPMVDRTTSDDAIHLIRALARNNELVSMLDEALAAADTPRNVEVFTEHLVQQHSAIRPRRRPWPESRDSNRRHFVRSSVERGVGSAAR